MYCTEKNSRTEDVSRTPEGLFLHRISIRYTRSLFFAPSAIENASRTVGGLFEHRVSIPYRRMGFPVPNITDT